MNLPTLHFMCISKKNNAGRIGNYTGVGGYKKNFRFVLYAFFGLSGFILKINDYFYFYN